MKKIIISLLILTFSAQLMVAQNLRRANQLFEKRAYINAAELFLNEKDKSQEVIEKLGDCYYFNSKMEDAVVWYQKAVKNNEIEPVYFYRYAQALKGTNNFSEADKWLSKYQEKNQLVSIDKIGTLNYFESLNREIERPYILHKTSLNSEGSDFVSSVLGNKLIFASTRNGGQLYDWNNKPYLDLFIADIDDAGNASNIQPLSKSINTKMHESNAVLTADGKTMYFTRNNFIEGKKQSDSNKITHLKIYKAQLVNNEWTNISELPFNSKTYSTEHPALSPDEKKLYFSSDMSGGIGSFDIYVVTINSDGTYGAPQNLGATINTEQREQFPFISSKNTLYFASDGHLGLGGLDVFKSEINSNSYSKPINLSTIINSSSDDFSFIIDEENETGYFASNRPGGLGDDDIYKFTQTKKYYVQGFVQNKNTLEIIPGATVTLFDTNNTKISEMTVGDAAAYSLEIKNNKTYKIKGSSSKYNPSTIEFSTDAEGNIDKNILLLLESYEDAEKDIVVDNGKTQIKINPIYFDFDKWNIRTDAALELNNVVAIMKKYPEMAIEIGAHTDSRGSDDYNLALSENRAKSVKEYLISRSIPAEKVTYKGYGETQPLNNCTNDVHCKSKEYDINRRCEFVIVD